MTSNRQGYLVVEKFLTDESLANPRYRGIHSTPPWSQDQYEAGFDDPYVFGRFSDQHGLIRTVGDAKEVLRRLTPIYPRDNLTIVFVEDQGQENAGFNEPEGTTLLGYDVAATDPPFWSPLSDPPVNPIIRSRLNQTNDYGLCPSSEAAHRSRYAPRARRFLSEDRQGGLSAKNFGCVEGARRRLPERDRRRGAARTPSSISRLTSCRGGASTDRAA